MSARTFAGATLSDGVTDILTMRGPEGPAHLSCRCFPPYERVMSRTPVVPSSSRAASKHSFRLIATSLFGQFLHRGVERDERLIRVVQSIHDPIEQRAGVPPRRIVGQAVGRRLLAKQRAQRVRIAEGEGCPNLIEQLLAFAMVERAHARGRSSSCAGKHLGQRNIFRAELDDDVSQGAAALIELQQLVAIFRQDQRRVFLEMNF